MTYTLKLEHYRTVYFTCDIALTVYRCTTPDHVEWAGGYGYYINMDEVRETFPNFSGVDVADIVYIATRNVITLKKFIELLVDFVRAVDTSDETYNKALRLIEMYFEIAISDEICFQFNFKTLPNLNE